MSGPYVMSGKELEELCNAAGYHFKAFCHAVGVRGPMIRRLRASPKIDLSDDLYAKSVLDQMRAGLSQQGTA